MDEKENEVRKEKEWALKIFKDSIENSVIRIRKVDDPNYFTDEGLALKILISTTQEYLYHP